MVKSCAAYGCTNVWRPDINRPYHRIMTASEEPSTRLRDAAILHNPDAVKYKAEKFGTDHTFKRKIVWPNVIGFLILHLGGFYGLYLMTKAHWYTDFWAVFLALAASEGVKAGAHRLYSHKAYKAKPLLRFILITLQTLAGQNCMYIWVRDHRQHHKYSDTDADPHNATRGFFFSHMGWLMSKKHPLVIKMGKTIDMSDLEADKMVMFQKKYYIPLYFVVAVIIPVSVPIYFWNESLWNALFTCYFCRYVFQLNGTWCVNSWAHIYGTRPYNKNILPVETYFVGYLALGEGWHNYHHAFPWDYKASELGAPANFTRFLIELWASMGLAYDLKSASDSLIERRFRNCGDGSVPTYSFLKNKIDNTNDKLQDVMDTHNLDDNEHRVSGNDSSVKDYKKSDVIGNRIERTVSPRA